MTMSHVQTPSFFIQVNTKPNETHMWPDSRCTHRKRTTNIVLKINNIFQDGDRNLKNSKIFPGIKGVVLIIQWGQFLPKIASCVTVFKMNDIFYFRQNSRGQIKFERLNSLEVLEE